MSRVSTGSPQSWASHSREYQSVVDLGLVDLCLVELHLHGQQVGASGHSGVDHGLDIVAQCVEQSHIAQGEPLLGFERHHLPVGGVDGIDDVLRLVALHLECQLLGEVRQSVERHYLASHVHRLRKGHGSEKTRCVCRRSWPLLVSEPRFRAHIARRAALAARYAVSGFFARLNSYFCVAGLNVFVGRS